MTDLEILGDLEKELGKFFRKGKLGHIQNTIFTEDSAYILDKQNNIIAIKIALSKLKKIPLNITRMKHLKMLNLSNTDITEFSLLNTLPWLTELYLSSNKIKDILSLQSLTQLTKLDLTGNDIFDVSSLQKLQQLRSLVLRLNRITNISALQNLKHLTELILFGNYINDITPLQNLKTLSVLDLGKNLVTEISALQNLKHLTNLYLDNNQITDISPLQGLKKLKTVGLQINPIKKIYSWMTDLDMRIQWREHETAGFITFFDNPIQTPPVEIIKQGKLAVKDWFAANKKRLNEIKVLLVGEAKAGKTSIIKKLKYNVFNEKQEQTDGIVIEKLKFDDLTMFNAQKKLHGTTGYFWDFGGQEIMSSTHQFFMTKRSVYVLVLEARKDAETDKQVRQWMERIQAFGGDSPVIIVGNKIDLNPSFGIDTTTLQRDFPQIKYFVNVSCQSNEGIDKLVEILAQYIPQAELFNTEIDERWIDIKARLQELTGQKNKLSHEEFINICSQHNLMSGENQTQAINFLNDLGIVLHFEKLDLAEYYVLDPLWVTAGVYRIITSDKAARQKGEISTEDLAYIVNDEFLNSKDVKHRAETLIKYTPYECRFLADIMAQFKLSYYTDNGAKILIPDLLDKETPKEASDRFDKAAEKVFLIYDYNYLPSTLMPNLIVELKADIVTAWRTGAILKCKANITAEAMIRITANRLSVVVLGDYKSKRAYLSIIRYFIEKINSNYSVNVNMLIPLPGFEKHTAKYEQLINMERAREKIYKDWDIIKEFEISVLLEGILSKEEVQKQAEKILSITNNYMGDTYNIPGQAGAVGPNASATGNTFNQQNNTLPDTTNFAALAIELATLKQALLSQATTPEHYKAIGEVAAAEDAAKSKDGNKVLKFLGSAGKWAWDAAKETGAKVIAEIIAKQMHL